MSRPELSAPITAFLSSYSAAEMDRIWFAQSQTFRDFLKNRVLGTQSGGIPDSECDPIIRILDRNGKGNTKDSQAIARAMIPQGAWRRIFNEFHQDRELGNLVLEILEETQPGARTSLIDRLYKLNEGRKNNLTGPSGNMIGCFLAAYDPQKNLSVISLKDRKSLIDYLNLELPFEWERASVGQKISQSNDILLSGLHTMGLQGSARTVSVFCYSSMMKPLWKGEHTLIREDKNVSVTVPESNDQEEPTATESTEVSLRESMQIQALICDIGAKMGFKIWLPRADRGRVLSAWNANPGELVDNLPLGFDATTMKTVELIDVLWLKRRSIVRAFEVEHTTAIYSGLLRMADLVALQPNLDIRLHIVAPEAKREKVFQEIKRPVFSLLQGRTLAEICTYIPYDSITQISELNHLAHLSDSVLQDYEISVDDETS